VNAEKFLEWHDHSRFIEDVMRFLDNVLEDFIVRAPPEMRHAVYAASRERSVGLGLMGFHSFLQSLSIPFESAMAKSWNLRLFKALRAGKLGGAGLDVFDAEPLPPDDPVRSLPNAVLTPHLGYVSQLNFESYFRNAVECVAAWAAGKPVRVI
jgi:hypothetical protein